MGAFRLVSGALILLVAAGLANAQSWPWPTTPIAGKGFAAPGHTGATFAGVNTDFGIHGGIVTLSGTTSLYYGGAPNNHGIWQYANGSLQQAAFDGGSISGTSTRLYAPSSTISNAAGDLACSNTNGGIVVRRSGSLAQIAGGNGAGSTPPGATGLGWGLMGTAAIDSAGKVVFQSSLSDSSYNTVGSGIWTDAFTGALQGLAITGAAAPGGYTYSSAGSDVRISGTAAANTTIVHSATLSDATSTYSSIVAHTSAGDRLIARFGQQVPDLAGYTFGWGLFTFANPYLADNGHTAFRAYLSGSRLNAPGIFLDTGSGPQTLVGPTTAVPGVTGATFIAVSDPVLNSNDRYAFGGTVSSGGNGLWATDANGTLQLVALQNQTAPGVPGGYVFNNFSPGAGSYAISDNGLVAFLADLVIPSTSTHAQALYMQDPAGGLDLIAYTGESFATGLTPSDTKTVYGITFVSMANPEANQLVEGNSLVYRLQFTNSSGPTEIFVSSVPEPGALALLAPALALILKRRANSHA